MKTSTLLGALLLVWASSAFAQSNTSNIGKISGLVYSDYYWIAANHNSSIKGKNGFWIRRVYFTYDREISDAISARFRLEGSSAGDFTSNTKLSPVVKDLYLKWQDENHQVIAGISSTPTFELVENIWGYRSVEKTPVDLLGFGSSRDLGITVKGKVGPEGKFNYDVMLGNGSSNGSETNKGKKIMVAVSYQLTDNVILQVYGDYNDNPGKQDWTTLQGFAGYQSDNVNAGLLLTHQIRNNVAGLPANINDLNLDIASLFANFSIGERVDGLIRIDHTFDPIPGVQNNSYFPISNQSPATILIAGIDVDMNYNIHLIPNFESAFYEKNDQTNITPNSDLIPRLTLSYNF